MYFDPNNTIFQDNIALDKIAYINNWQKLNQLDQNTIGFLKGNAQFIFLSNPTK